MVNFNTTSAKKHERTSFPSYILQQSLTFRKNIFIKKFSRKGNLRTSCTLLSKIVNCQLSLVIFIRGQTFARPRTKKCSSADE